MFRVASVPDRPVCLRHRQVRWQSGTAATQKVRFIFENYLTQNPRSPTRELLERWKKEEFELIYSTTLLVEYQEKFKERGIEDLAEEFLATLIGSGIYVHLNPDDIKPVIIDDSDDDIIIASAVVGQATHIVTYDSHFDHLGDEYQGIKIIDGLHFLYEVRGNIIM